MGRLNRISRGVVCLLLVAQFASFGLAESNVTTQAGSTLIPAGNETTTSAPTTTAAKTTTHPTTNMTTSAPTTTPAKTTTHPTTNTTTKVHPTNATSTTVAPGPSVGNWTVKDKNGDVCMLMSFTGQMNVSYTKKNKKEDSVVVVDVMANATLTSDCSNSSTRTLIINPFSNNLMWTILLVFKQESGEYSLTEVGSSWQYDGRFSHPESSGPFYESAQQDNFLNPAVTLGSFYNCTENPLTVKTGRATVRLSHMQLQPFAYNTSGQYGKAEQCSTGLSRAAIIGIAVGGAVLLLLIIIVVCVVAKKVAKKNKPYQSFSSE